MTTTEDRRLQALHAAVRVYEASGSTAKDRKEILVHAKKFDDFLASGKVS